MAAFRNVRVEIASPRALITLDRPEKLNALDSAALNELGTALDIIENDASARAVIVTGAGDKAFAAGADIAELATLAPAATPGFAARGLQLFRRLETFRKPVIAAINGFALGGGLELALACTFRIAADSARLGLPETRLGLIPGYGGTQRLPRLIGPSAALELILTGEPVSAAEALRLGLVDRVVPAAALLAEADTLVGRLAVPSAQAQAAALDAVRRGLDLPLDEALKHETRRFAQAAASDDGREGMAAFLAKRPPKFTS